MSFRLQFVTALIQATLCPNSVSKLRILVIDDNADHLDILQVELGQQYEVLTVLEGLDGYALAVNDDVAAIVLDVHMPLIDGWTVLQKLRTNPTTRHVPVIILTALELDDAEQTRAQQFGVVTVMRKPVDLKGRQGSRSSHRSFRALAFLSGCFASITPRLFTTPWTERNR